MEDRLQKFVSVVEKGSFTAAAEVLHISQPALTMAVAKLEKELKSHLIVKGVRPLKLTDAGEIAYRWGVAQGDVMSSLMSELSDLNTGRQHFTIGMIDSVAAMLASEMKALESLEECHDISLIVDNSRKLKADVLDGVSQLSFVVQSDHDAGLKTRYVGDEILLLVTAPSQLLTVERGLSNGRLERLISYDNTSTTFELVRRSIDELGIQADAGLFSTSPDVMLRLARAGRGAAVLPFVMVEDSLREGSLVLPEYSGQPIFISRAFSTAVHPSRHMSHDLDSFSESVRSILLDFRRRAEQYVNG